MAAKGPGAPGGSDPEYFAAAMTPSGGGEEGGVEARNFFGGNRTSGPGPMDKPAGEYGGPGDVKVNGADATAQPLADGDILDLGCFQFRFRVVEHSIQGRRSQEVHSHTHDSVVVQS